MQSEQRGFPILGSSAGNGAYTVPWDFVAAHDPQAQRNHGQTLKRLAERGGLSWCELRAVVEDRPWRKGEVAEDRDAVLSAVTRWRTREALAVQTEVDAAITILRGENERLRQAIEPFVAIARDLGSAAPDGAYLEDIGHATSITVGMLRTLLTALAPTRATPLTSKAP